MTSERFKELEKIANEWDYSTGETEVHRALNETLDEIERLQTPHKCMECKHISPDHVVCFCSISGVVAIGDSRTLWICGHWKKLVD